MVVVQVPLWILHGNTPSSSASSSALLGIQPPSSSAAESHASSGDASSYKKQTKIQNQLHLWDPSIRVSSSTAIKRSAIYCCDITCGPAYLTASKTGHNEDHGSPDNLDTARLATGGGDGTIKIWSLNSLFTTTNNTNNNSMATFDPAMGYMSSDESFTTCSTSSSSKRKLNSTSPWQSSIPPDTRHRIIASLSSHSGSVLTLRFSTFGQYLASGGDDASIFIHVRSYHTTQSSLNNASKTTSHPQETWNRIFVLRGHNLDVVGLSWAPDDSYLISCSLDSHSPIGVWHIPPRSINPGSSTSSTAAWITPTVLRPLKILGKEHTSTVKGVAFDPAGRYFVSSGDDPAICIWRVEDWALDRKIDAYNSDIFPSTFHRKKSNRSEKSHPLSSTTQTQEEDDRDLQTLSSLSLFRRISFAPDGSHVCVTNATLRGKNIAAVISREDHWAVSGSGEDPDGKTLQRNSSDHDSSSSRQAATGAANLVGHKQPVVCSRHCPYLFKTTKSSSDLDRQEEDDDKLEQNYAILVALGDKKGFVTVWSTKKNRPLFKLQCGESQATVTDMSWGLLPISGTSKMSLILVVSLLDGFVTTIRFEIPGEVSPLLSVEQRNHIFRCKYGIDFNSISSTSDTHGTRRWVDDKAGPSLLENILPFDINDSEQVKEGASNALTHRSSNDRGKVRQTVNAMEPPMLRPAESQQVIEHIKGGKKRIRPVLMTAGNDDHALISSEVNSNNRQEDAYKADKKKVDDDPLVSAEKAITIAETMNAKLGKKEMASNRQGESSHEQGRGASSPIGGPVNHISSQQENGFHHRGKLHIPVSKDKVYTVDLAVRKEPHTSSLDSSQQQIIVGSCINAMERMPGSNKSVPCVGVSITQASTVSWREMIYGATCTCVASSSNVFAIGTSDGSLYLYSSSPTSGWLSGIGYRSHPPLIFSSSIVRLSCMEQTPIESNGSHVKISTLLVFTSDGIFCVYNVHPCIKLVYKGDIHAPMNHIRHSVYGGTQQQQDSFSSSSAQVSRIQLMESHHILLLLSSPPITSTQMIVAGGPLYAFVYNYENELWMRVADSRFVFSDFYSALPGQQFCDGPVTSKRILGSIEDVIHCDIGRALHKKGSNNNDYSTTGMYSHTEENGDGAYLTTRAHCEDRMSCALALGSTNEFLYWLRLYVRNLSCHGSSTHLRFLLQIFLGHELKDDVNEESMNDGEVNNSVLCPWWTAYKRACGTNWDGVDIVQKIILPEMSKNTSLRRLVYEIDTEIKLTLIR